MPLCVRSTEELRQVSTAEIRCVFCGADSLRTPRDGGAVGSDGEGRARVPSVGWPLQRKVSGSDALLRVPGKVFHALHLRRKSRVCLWVRLRALPKRSGAVAALVVSQCSLSARSSLCAKGRLEGGVLRLEPKCVQKPGGYFGGVGRHWPLLQHSRLVREPEGLALGLDSLRVSDEARAERAGEPYALRRSSHRGPVFLAGRRRPDGAHSERDGPARHSELGSQSRAKGVQVGERRQRALVVPSPETRRPRTGGSRRWGKARREALRTFPQVDEDCSGAVDDGRPLLQPRSHSVLW